ncbi:hypothetical protein AAG570_007891 [Ranatra chinensis]|uniref:Uncharacterized protein n=1 Tax=Ranatra chinensis TaxID=642074 RepID=A0ABD0YH02_9HEMI
MPQRKATSTLSPSLPHLRKPKNSLSLVKRRDITMVTNILKQRLQVKFAKYELYTPDLFVKSQKSRIPNSIKCLVNIEENFAQGRRRLNVLYGDLRAKEGKVGGSQGKRRTINSSDKVVIREVFYGGDVVSPKKFLNPMRVGRIGAKEGICPIWPYRNDEMGTGQDGILIPNGG